MYEGVHGYPKSLKEHACVWRVILLEEENKELGLMNANTGVVVKLNDISRNELCGVDKIFPLSSKVTWILQARIKYFCQHHG
jgi:hypothetical protein